MSERIISVVAALIRDNDGRVLLVRKRGTSAFMQPGGKRDVDESDLAALSREVAEELGCRVVAETARPLGVLIAQRRTNPAIGCRPQYTRSMSRAR
jgi:8-oxo-dGTP diphosphatase